MKTKLTSEKNYSLFYKPDNTHFFTKTHFFMKKMNLIKKFEYEDRFRRLWFKGTSDMSISKKMIGPISKKNIIGKVILVIRKNGLLFNL